MIKIICIKGNCDTGKTTTVHLIYQKITGEKWPLKEIDTVVEYNGKRIALISAGDPGTNVFGKVKKHIDANDVDIIIFSARTKYFRTRLTVYEKDIEPHIVDNTFFGVDYKEYTLHIRFKKNGCKEEFDAFINECENLATEILSIL